MSDISRKYSLDLPESTLRTEGLWQKNFWPRCADESGLVECRQLVWRKRPCRQRFQPTRSDPWTRISSLADSEDPLRKTAPTLHLQSNPNWTLKNANHVSLESDDKKLNIIEQRHNNRVFSVGWYLVQNASSIPEISWRSMHPKCHTTLQVSEWISV